MYILGAVETFQTGFGFEDVFPMDRELIAIGVITCLAIIVYVGIQYVARVAIVFLGTVLVSIVLALAGVIAFAAGADFGSTDEVERADSPSWTPEFTRDEATGVTPDFQVLLSIFVPAVTGIMAGSNLSAHLKDPAKAIPTGTLGAVATTSTLYLLVIFLFGSFVDRQDLLEDKLVMATLAWPFKHVVSVGILLSSVGAGLQCMTGAPQLLANMMSDDVLPFRAATHTVLKKLYDWCGCCNNASAGEEPAGRKVSQHDDLAAAASPSEPHRDVPGDATSDRGPTGRKASLDDSLEVIRSSVSARRSTAATWQANRTGRDSMNEIELQIARRESLGWCDHHAEAAAAAAAVSGASAGAEGGVVGDEENNVAAAPAEEKEPSGDTSNPESTDSSVSQEPTKRVVAGFGAIFTTWLIASVPCLAGNLDEITPVQTIFYLMMFGTINVAALTHSVSRAAGFRPRRPIHWSVSLFGAVACLVVIMLVSWWQGLIVFALAAGLYYWIQHGEQQETWGDWGSGMDAMQLGRAHRSLLNLRNLHFSAKNWRPQILLLLETDDVGRPHRPELLFLVGQLKKGHGLTVVLSAKQGRVLTALNQELERRELDHAGHSSVQGQPPTRYSPVDTVVHRRQHVLEEAMDVTGVDGFARVAICNDVFDGLTTSMQTIGLGPLCPNTVFVGWPRHFDMDGGQTESFVAFLKTAIRMNDSVIAYKCDLDAATRSMEEVPEDGTIDLWWQMHDSGLILLLPHLLSQHRVWRKCRLRLFAVDSSMSGREEDIARYLRSVRIPAEVFVIPVDEEVTDAVMAGRTMTPEMRGRILSDLEKRRGGTGAAARGLTMAIREGEGGSPRPNIREVFGTSEDAQEGLDRQGRGMNGDAAISSEPADMTSETHASETESPFLRSAAVLNEYIRHYSSDAALVVSNLALTRNVNPREFVEFTNIFTQGIERALLVRGAGYEVVTIYA